MIVHCVSNIFCIICISLLNKLGILIFWCFGNEAFIDINNGHLRVVNIIYSHLANINFNKIVVRICVFCLCEN